jgi:hypothetical protein
MKNEGKFDAGFRILTGSGLRIRGDSNVSGGHRTGELEEIRSPGLAAVVPRITQSGRCCKEESQQHYKKWSRSHHPHFLLLL